MGAPVLNGPFVMPMFRSFVPRKMQPWIYLFIAVTFQLSGGVYLGALNHMIGGMAVMREDILMCMYANLAGMAIYFPLLFRMKFRFTNKTLLTSAALGVLLCNLIAPHITFLPLLWLICFIEGMCKIQGTFECMSNIQLWMTPKRDFTVFFPWLHIVILGSIQLSDLITTYLMFHYHWTYMNLFIAGLMLIVLLIQTTCIKHFRFMRKFPLFGIDWLGGALWAALLAEIAFLFNYGDWYDWWNSPVIRQLTIAILITLGFCIWRMMTIRHPFLEPKMWTYRHYWPLLGLVTLVEAFLATEHVLEEVFYEEVMKYEELVSVRIHRTDRLSGRILSDAFHRHTYFTTLPADHLPWLRLCRIERHLYGVPGRDHDFPAFLSGVRCVQHAPHGNRRRTGRRSLCTRTGLLRPG